MTEFVEYIEQYKNDNLFSLLLNSLTDGINILNSEGIILLANDAYCSMMDKPISEVIGIPYTDLYNKSLRSEILQMYQRNFRLKQLTPRFTRELILWNDKKVWLDFLNHSLELPGVEPVVLRVIKDVTDQKKMEIEHKESSVMLRNFATHQQKVREDERTTIAREIHDELGQVLTVLKIQNSLVGKKLKGDQQDLKEKIEATDNMINQAVDSVQKICTKLRPGILDNLGLVPAIEWHCKEFQKSTGIKCNYDLFKGELKIPPRKATAIYRIFQETLTNVARHSGADKVDIEFSVIGNNIVLQVKDNGMGITKEKIQLSSSLGLIGMKERAMIFNGDVKISAGSNGGTEVTLRIPKKDNRELL